MVLALAKDAITFSAQDVYIVGITFPTAQSHAQPVSKSSFSKSSLA
jgi:hypothetical protein